MTEPLTVSQELQSYIDRIENQRREMLRLAENNRSDRRVANHPIAHEERRIGPRRWLEKRAAGRAT